MSYLMLRLARASVGLTLACSLAIGGAAPSALAHERVMLTPQHSSPSRGPLLTDGTIARAAFATFNGMGQTRGFRLQLRAGQDLRMELLIPDAPPANRLPRAQLPEVTVLAPDGTRIVMAINERTPFYEPYSGTSYLYLSRLRTKALAGIYRVLVASRSNDEVAAVVGIGYREVAGH